MSLTSNQNDERKVMEKALMGFYWEQILLKYQDNFELEANKEKTKIVFMKRDFEALQVLVNSLINDLAESKTELWSIRNLIPIGAKVTEVIKNGNI